MKYGVALLLAASGFCSAAFIEHKPDIQFVENGFEGECSTSRYWDCCKPTCAWVGNTDTDVGPVKACDINGETVSDGNVQSGCEVDGSSYICNNQQSLVVNSSLAYGFAAAAFIDPPENMCCTCFLVTFQVGEWGDCSGKQMIVQITNTGGSSSTNSTENNIEFNIPGGGVGYYTLGCKKQWNAPDQGWGEQYGGVGTEEECNQLPEVLQPGCKFRWEFLNGCSNPPATFKQVVCPQEIVDLSGCKMD